MRRASFLAVLVVGFFGGYAIGYAAMTAWLR